MKEKGRWHYDYLQCMGPIILGYVLAFVTLALHMLLHDPVTSLSLSNLFTCCPAAGCIFKGIFYDPTDVFCLPGKIKCLPGSEPMFKSNISNISTDWNLH